MGRSELPVEIVEALHLELQAQLAAKKWDQSALAKRAKCSQVAVSKLYRRPEVGRSVAERLLKPLGYKTFEEVVLRHKTRVTANDVARYLQKFPSLAETLRDEGARWNVDTLVKLVSTLRREPALSRPDGQPKSGTWADMLDEIAEGREPAVLRTVEQFSQ